MKPLKNINIKLKNLAISLLPISIGAIISIKSLNINSNSKNELTIGSIDGVTEINQTNNSSNPIIGIALILLGIIYLAITMRNKKENDNKKTN